MKFTESVLHYTTLCFIGVILFLVVSCDFSEKKGGAPEAKKETAETTRKDETAAPEKKETQSLKGKFKQLSSEAKSISVTDKDTVIVFKYTEETVLKNVASVKDLKHDETVIIVYEEAGPQKIATAITKAMAWISKDVREIKTPELFELVSAQQAGKDFVLIDSRPAEKYQEAHIPGAISIPFSELKKTGGEALLPVDTKDIQLIFYCGGPTWTMSVNSAELAKKNGFGTVSVYLEGFPGWKDEGHRLSSGIEHVQSGNIVLVDLRAGKEVEAGHIPRAVNIPLDTLVDHESDFPANRDAPIVFYTDKDADAVKAMNEVTGWGYQNVSYFPGGAGSWVDQGHALEIGPAASMIQWERTPDPGEINKDDFEKALQTSEAVIVDVRSAQNFAKGHIKGAIHIPSEEFPSRVSELPRDKLILLYCASGLRAELGYDSIKDKQLNVKFLKQHLAVGADGAYELMD